MVAVGNKTVPSLEGRDNKQVNTQSQAVKQCIPLIQYINETNGHQLFHRESICLFEATKIPKFVSYGKHTVCQYLNI